MNILMIAINDPAGMGIAFTNAINRYSEHRCRLITKEIRYNFMFEKDLHLPWLTQDGWEEVEELLKKSDVFHFHMTADEDLELGPFRPADYLRGKVIVHHHHGHPDFRANPEKYRQKYRQRGRRNLLVSTPDLLKLLPEARWQPNIVPINDPLYTPLPGKPQTPVLVCHSPTRRDLKNTSDFIAAFNRAKQTSTIPTELHLIENTSHRECLRLKRESHILLDHLQGYFGVSSLEGLSQGLCVVAGLDEWNLRHIKEFTGSDALPWSIPAVSRPLSVHVQNLINDSGEREERGRAARRFMENSWSDSLVGGYLASIYAN